MFRKIEFNYSLSGDKTELYLHYTEENKNYICNINKDYNVKARCSGELYNEILMDLDGEFDDDLASVIAKLVDSVFKEIDKDEI